MNDQNKDEANSSKKLTIMSLFIIVGSLGTITSKFQNTQYVYQGAFYKYFFHPYIQAAVMFFGQFFALIFYFIMKAKDRQGHKFRMLEAQSKGKLAKMNKLYLAVPAFLDLISSTLQLTALNFIPGSVYQMMRGGTIVTTFILSILFLKIKIQKNMVIGSLLAFFGITIVGASNIVFSNGSQASTDIGLQIFGYILIIASLFFNGFIFVFQQKLFSKYHLDPLYVVGYQGLFGFSMYLVIIPIISYIPCQFGVEACVFDESSRLYLQSSTAYFRQVTSSGILLAFCILGIVATCVYNVMGVAITKYINALARSIADVTRTVLIWTISILITITVGSKYPNYLWQLTKIQAIGIQLIGFVILVCGNLIYNDVIQIDKRLLKKIDYNEEESYEKITQK